MEDPNSTLLPYILETLSRKPELSDSFDNLCKEIEDQLRIEENSRYGNVRNALQRALSVGQSLGIITLTNETIRVPFNFRANSKTPRIMPTSANQYLPQPAIGTGNQPPPNFGGTSNNPRKRPVSNSNEHGTKDADPEYVRVPKQRSKPARKQRRPRPRGRSYARKSYAAMGHGCGRSKTRGRGRSRGARGRCRSHVRSHVRRRR